MQKTLQFLCVATVLACTAMVTAQQLDPAGEAAVHLLKRTTRFSRDNDHGTLLEALRHLRDPDLAPLFEKLADSSNRSLRFHGLLGLAEIATPAQLDLTRIMEIQDTDMLAALVGEAVSNELLDEHQAQQMLDWETLDLGIKVFLASHMINKGVTVDPSILREALTSEKLGRRGLAMLLLAQQGDDAALQQLMELENSDDPQRDPVRAMLLNVAAEQKMEAVIPWVEQVRTSPEVSTQLKMIAMSTGMRLGSADSIRSWQEEYAKARSMAQKMRLAITALQAAESIPPSLFDTLITEQDNTELLAQIGRTGAAIAQGSGIADQVVALIQLNHQIGRASCRERV